MLIFPDDLPTLIQHDGAAAAAVSAGLVSLLALSELLYRRFRVNVEGTRKLSHAGSGLLVLMVPHLFEYALTVLVLGGAFFCIMVGSRLVGMLPSIHAVKRRSTGAYLYPLSVMIVLILSDGDPLLFQLPILALAISDACAALIGRRYGRLRYRILSQTRTVEGSVTFFVVTFLVIQVPLLLLGTLGRAETLLIALILALLITGFEAISVGGTDNLIIPVVTLLSLQRAMPLDTTALMMRVGWMAALIVVGLLSYRSRRITFSAGVACFLMAYTSMMLGGWAWCAPLLVLYFTFNLGVPLEKLSHPRSAWFARDGGRDLNDISIIYHLFFVGVVALLWNSRLPSTALYGAWVASTGVAFAFCWSRFAEVRARQDAGGSLRLGNVSASARAAFGALGGVVMAVAMGVYFTWDVAGGLIPVLLAGAASTIGVLVLLIVGARWPIELPVGVDGVHAGRPGLLPLSLERAALAAQLGCMCIYGVSLAVMHAVAG